MDAADTNGFICVSHLNQRYQRSICSIEYPKVEECDATGDDSSNTVWFIKKSIA